MPERTKKIFYLEDDGESVNDHYKVLREYYKVTLGAHEDLVATRRDEPFDLLILDLMIHPESSDAAGTIAKSIAFDKVEWQRVGLEFLERIRRGEYEEFGFPIDIPVVVATAVGEYRVQEKTIGELQVRADAYLEKPFTVDALLEAVAKCLKW